MKDPARSAMHGFGGAIDPTSEHECDSLKSQTYSQNRDTRFPDDLSTDSEVSIVVRPAGSRRNDDAAGIERENLRPREGVVMHDNRQFTVNRCHHLEKIECKRIVIIDDECFHEKVSHY